MFRSVGVKAAFLFGSGFCALVYQTMWLRALRTVFGASTPANAAVLSVLLGAFAVGSAVFARRAERTSQPLRLYARLEMGVAASAALSPFLVDGVRAVYLALGGSTTLGAGATAARLVLSVFALGVPAALMGGTFPAMARAAGDAARETRKPLALFFGASTLGAVVGAAASTFALLEIYGVRRSIWIACAANALVAVVARNRARSSRPVAAMPRPEGGAPRARRLFVLVAAFLTGLSFLLLELVWYRLSAPLLGGSAYTYGIVVLLALFGVGAGGLAFAFFGPRRPTPAGFAVTCALEAALALVPYALGDDLARLAYFLRALASPALSSMVAGQAVLAAILVVPPALVAGWQFPSLLSLAGDGIEGAAVDSGDVYASNTAGSLLGALAGGLGLLPLLSAPGAWKLAALLLVGAGLFAATRPRVSSPAERARVVAFAALALVTTSLAFATGPTALWRQSGVGAGRAHLWAETWNDLHALTYDARRLTDQREGLEAGLGFRTMATHGEALLVNGASDGATFGDEGTHVGLGLVPALIHGAPKRALVLGLGTGQTAGWLAAVPTMERVDVAEVEPALLDFAARTALTNKDVMHDRKVNIVVADGREALATSKGGYDLIVSAPSSAPRAGLAGLSALELYQTARGKLAPGGIFAQWMPADAVDLATMETVLATLSAVFPDVTIFRLGPGDVLLLGRTSKAPLDVPRLRVTLAREPYRFFVEHMLWQTDVEGLLSRVCGNDAFVHRLAARAGGMSTDNRPALDNGVRRSLADAFDEMRTQSRLLGEDLPALSEPVDRAAVDRQAGRVYTAEGSPAPQGVGDPVERAWAARQYARAAALAATRPAHDSVGALIRAHAGAVGGGRPAAGDLDALVAAGFATDVAFIRVDAAVTDGDGAHLPALVDAAVAALARDPWVNQVILASVLERVPRAAMSPEQALAVARSLSTPLPGKAAFVARVTCVHELLMRAPASMPGWCAGVYGSIEPDPLWTESWLRGRAACYSTHDAARVGGARADLAAFLAHQAPTLKDALAP